MEEQADEIAAHLKQGKFAEAAKLADALLRADPSQAKVWQLKGMALAKLGDNGGAIGCYNKAIQCKPDFKEACFDLAVTLERMDKTDLAIKAYSHWLKIEQAQGVPPPTALNAIQTKALQEWFFQGEAFQKQGDHKKAETAYRKALAIHPHMPEALTNLGNALYYQKRYEEAVEALLHCLRVKPRHVDALNTLGTIYKHRKFPACAVAAYRQALAAQPDYLPALINISNIYYEMKRFGEAVETYERILPIDPGNGDVLCHLAHMLYRFCRWDEAEKAKTNMHQMLLAARQPMAPLIVTTLFDSAPLQRENAKSYTAKFHPAGRLYDSAAQLSRGGDKMRIGYLSSDFHSHATLYLMAELFERHDAGRFEVHAYSYGKGDGSAPLARVKNSVQGFHDIQALNDDSAAASIARDEMDILVDLKGYTQGQRLGILAGRPAPVQLHYLGYPGTLGAGFIDYFITDGVASPAGADADFTEALIRLPHSYQINDRKRALPSAPLTRQAYGLPETGFVFCDFNNSYKITPELFAVWMRLLKAVEGSVLWLYETHVEATLNLRNEAKKHGVDPARIVMATNAPHEQHLSRYRHADLVLDTFPVSGHTTTSDALWAGTPVLAMAGNSFVSRVAASLLHAAGLPELVAPDIVSYEAMALGLTHDKARLGQLKRHLEERRMQLPLFDSDATTRALEAAYLHVLERHRAGLPPEGFAVDGDRHIVLRSGHGYIG